MGKPLNLIRYGRQKWRWQDRVLAVALTLHEESLCARCGHPRDRAYNPDMEGWFSTVEHTCQACATMDRYQADHKDTAPVPGRKVGIADDGWEERFVPNPRYLLGPAKQSHHEQHESGQSEHRHEQ